MLGKTSGHHGEAGPCLRYFWGEGLSEAFFRELGLLKKNVVEFIHGAAVHCEV